MTGSVAMMRALLPAGPDLKVTNRYGGVSLIPAAESGHVDYVRAVSARPASTSTTSTSWAGPPCWRP